LLLKVTQVIGNRNRDSAHLAVILIKMQTITFPLMTLECHIWDRTWLLSRSLDTLTVSLTRDLTKFDI